mmetsp:Transcript_26490/g.70314  ORF Transcript_26490/g.70314 Transcript_26490/m.70314 type:complete len:168 (-) Transcript_26490:1972-2475(-)
MSHPEGGCCGLGRCVRGAGAVPGGVAAIEAPAAATADRLAAAASAAPGAPQVGTRSGAPWVRRMGPSFGGVRGGCRAAAARKEGSAAKAAWDSRRRSAATASAAAGGLTAGGSPTAAVAVGEGGTAATACGADAEPPLLRWRCEVALRPVAVRLWFLGDEHGPVDQL